MSDRVLDYAIVAKDEASRALASARQAFKDAQDAVATASKAVEKHTATQADLAKTLEYAKRKESEAAAAAVEYEKAQKAAAAATEEMVRAERVKDGKLRIAKTEVERLKTITERAGGADRNLARDTANLGRALDSLSRGNITGAIASLGKFGQAALGASGIVMGVVGAVKLAYEAWERYQEKVKAARIEADAKRLEAIAKAGERAADAIGRIAVRYGDLRAAASSALAAAQEAASAGRSLANANAQGDYLDSLAGLSPKEREAAERRKRKSDLAAAGFSEAKSYRLQSGALDTDARYLDRELAELRKQASRLEATQSKLRQSAIRGTDAETRAAAEEKADAVLEKELEVQKQIRALEKERAALAQRRASLDLSHKAALKDIDNQNKALNLAEDERLRKLKEQRDELQRQADARSKARTEAVAEAKELAELEGAVGGANDPALRFNAQRDLMKRQAEFQLAPLRGEAEATRIAREKAEQRGDEDEILNAKLREKDATEELAKAEALLTAQTAKRLQELAQGEQKAANARVEAAVKEQQAAEQARKALNMDDLAAEREGMRKAKAEQKGRERFQRASSNAVDAWRRQVLGRFDESKMWDISGKEGEEVLGNAEQAAAFRRLGRRERAALLAEARKRKAEEEARNNAQQAQGAAVAAAAAAGAAAAAIAAINPNDITAAINSLTQISQINMGNAETAIPDARPKTSPAANILSKALFGG